VFHDINSQSRGKVYDGRFTQQVSEKFTGLTKNAISEVINAKLDERLKKALTNNQGGQGEKAESLDAKVVDIPADDNGIVTTDEEIEAHRIIQAIGAEFVEPERITMKDAKSYCAIFMDNTNRQPICRFYFGKKRLSFCVYAPNNESNFDITRPSDLYKHKDLIKEAIIQYLALPLYVNEVDLFVAGLD